MSTNDKLIMLTTYLWVTQWFTRLIFVVAIAAPRRRLYRAKAFGAATCEKSDEFLKLLVTALSIFSVRGSILGSIRM